MSAGSLNAQRQIEYLQILEQRVRIKVEDERVRQLLLANFGAMSAPASGESFELEYCVSGIRGRYGLDLCGRESVADLDSADLIYVLEQHLTVELQKKRSDLLFLHAAALAWQEKAFILAAESGSGKSTTTWALLHHGFNYLSDELSPIDLETLRVYPYPHAICLKQPPPSPYELPQAALDLEATIHVPVSALPADVATASCPIGGVFLLKYCADLPQPALKRLGQAEAAARIYVTMLNALAHPDFGLAPVTRLVQHVPCFEILTAGLGESCNLIRSTAADITGV